MTRKFLEILDRERKQLKQICTLASVLHSSLLNYDTVMTESVTEKQNIALVRLSELDGERINHLMEWLKLSREEANNLHLSIIERNLKGEAKNYVRRLREEISSLQFELDGFNRQNRVLANRARHSVSNIIQMMSSERTSLYNVQV